MKGRSWLAALFVFALALHSYAVEARPRKSFSKKTRASIVDSVARTIDSVYVFPDVAKDMSAKIRSELQAGNYDSFDEIPPFVMRLTEDLRSVSNDKHVSVFPLPEGQSEKTTQAERDAMQREDLRYNNYGFKELRWLEGNVGYIKLNQFAAADLGGETAIATMNYFANADALIFDLRENGGGDPSMIQLISSYLFDVPTHLNDFFLRADSSIQQFWTQSSVPGKKLTDVPVYVLTSPGTFSAAEEFSNNLKVLKRGTIVGQTTGGGAHPNDFYSFASLGVQLSVPFGRAINPVTKTNWEGTGVTPDIECDQAAALDAAHFDALKKLEAKKQSPQIATQIRWAKEGLEAKMNPYKASETDMSSCVGVFGPRSVTSENGELWYQREGGPKRRLVPMAKHRFQLEGVDFFRVRFIADKNGAVSELEGNYSDGRVDRNKRGQAPPNSGG